jgi:hypothetical protein
MTREQLKKEASKIVILLDNMGGDDNIGFDGAMDIMDLIARQDAYIDKLVAALIHLRDTNHIVRVDDLDLTALKGQ